MSLSDILSLRMLLASQSPRRRQLLEQMGFTVELVNVSTEEVFDASLEDYAIAEHLAYIKNRSYSLPLPERAVLVTADTLVFADGKPLGKPHDIAQAVHYLNLLKGRSHKVITACCLRSRNDMKIFHQTAEVHFRNLTDEEINHYIERYKPFDKAGAYGIQEWIGLIGIERIAGDYYTIMGLPCEQLFCMLKQMNI